MLKQKQRPCSACRGWREDDDGNSKHKRVWGETAWPSAFGCLLPRGALQAGHGPGRDPGWAPGISRRGHPHIIPLALGRARGSRSLPHIQPQSLATPARFEVAWPRSQALSCPWDLWLPPAPCLRSCWLLSLIQTLQDHIWAAAVTRLGKKGACGCYLGGREIKGTGAAAPHRGNVFMSTNSNQRTGAVCFISARGSPFIWVRDVLRGSFGGHRVARVPASLPRLHQHLDGSVRPPAARCAAPCRVPCRSQHQQQS